MLPLLTELGVSPEIQQYFGLQETVFDYGDEQEIFELDRHLVPLTADLWLNGSCPATELIITSSAMEAIAYMALNAWRHPAAAQLSFIALGLRPQPEQLRWIGRYCLKRKITLVFPDDLCGRLADIVVAAGVRGRTVRAVWHHDRVRLVLTNMTVELPVQKISLHAFEKAASVRTAVRTLKPGRYITFLDQLRHDNKP